MRYKLRLNKTIINSFFGSLSPFSLKSNNCINENPENICIVSLLEIKISENFIINFSTNCMISNIMSLTFKVLFDKLIEINKYGIPVYGIASSLEQIIFEMNIGNLTLKILREESNCYVCISSINTEVKFKYSDIVSTMLISIIIDYVEFTLSMLKEKSEYIEETVKMLDESLKKLNLEKIKFERIPEYQKNSLYMYIFNSTTNEEHVYLTEVFQSLIFEENKENKEDKENKENKCQVCESLDKCQVCESSFQDKCQVCESSNKKRIMLSDTESTFSFNISSVSTNTF